MKLPGVYRIGLNESQYMVTALRSKYNFRKLRSLSNEGNERVVCSRLLLNVSSHECETRWSLQYQRSEEQAVGLSESAVLHQVMSITTTIESVGGLRVRLKISQQAGVE